MSNVFGKFFLIVIALEFCDSNVLAIPKQSCVTPLNLDLYVHYSFKFPASYDSLYNIDGPYVMLSFVFIFNQAFIDLMTKGFPFLEKYLIANPTNFLFQ